MNSHNAMRSTAPNTMHSSISFDDNRCKATLYQHSTATHTVADAKSTSRKAILYYHGGGFIYGSHEDLPQIYRDMLLDTGYLFVGIDYPLSPESPLCNTLAQLSSFTAQLIDELTAKHQVAEVFFFGRSAGGYLAIKLTELLLPTYHERIGGLISFYGFYDFRSEIEAQSGSFTQLPPIQYESVHKALEKTAPLVGTSPSRFMMYAYARQQHCWFSLLGLDDMHKVDTADASAFVTPDAGVANTAPNATTGVANTTPNAATGVANTTPNATTGVANATHFAVSDLALATFPKAFITASTTDKEIPFKVSKELSRKIPNATFYPVYNVEHNFDDKHPDMGVEFYKKLLAWLERS